MRSQKHIQDELHRLGSGLPVNNNQPFTVPEGYFESLADGILAKIKATEGSVQSELQELSPLLAGISKQTPYAVPPSYFDDNIIGAGILEQETASPVLDAIGKTMPYTTPEGYFENLPNEIVKSVQPKAKVVPLFGRTWMRVASAAAVAGALFLGGYQLLSSNNKAGNRIATAAGTSTQPIRKEIKQVSTEDLEQFIATVQAVPAKPKAAGASTKDNEKQEVEALLKDVSTSEMESFLSAIPNLDDELILTD
ncbi:MAG TPA: hypothetical protein VMR70_05695 [Flavisolibacter sp.]|nr:hypothetical protein [Flavisolibacter sp.]